MNTPTDTEEELNTKHTLSMSLREIAEFLCAAAAAKSNVSQKLHAQWMKNQTPLYIPAAKAILSRYAVDSQVLHTTYDVDRKQVAEVIKLNKTEKKDES